MNSDDRKQAWKFLRELTGGAILFAACLLALLQAPYWNRPVSLDELRVGRTLKLSEGDASYHTFVGNSLIYRGIDLGLLQNETGIPHSVIRAKGGRVHDLLFAVEDLLESKNPPQRLYLQAELLYPTNKEDLRWEGAAWSSFGRFWPRTFNKYKAALLHLDWQQDALDLIHPKISELTEFERFMPDFILALDSPQLPEMASDTLSFFKASNVQASCLDSNFSLNSIAKKDRIEHVDPSEFKRDAFERLEKLSAAVGTEIFWVSVPMLKGMDFYDDSLMVELEEICQTNSWHLLDIAADKKFTEQPAYFQAIENLTTRTNLHLCQAGRIAFTEELIRRLKSSGQLLKKPSEHLTEATRNFPGAQP